MNIILCDNDSVFLNELKDLLEKFLAESDVKTYHFFVFTSGEALIHYYQSTPNFHPDLLFLDIDMPILNGFAVLKYLNTINHHCITFIISIRREFVFDCFEFNIFQFIPKPIVPETLKSHFFRALNKYKTLNKKIIIYQEKKHIVIIINDIICIESYGHQITLFTIHGTYHTNAKISNLEALLTYHNFLRSHKSFIINMDRVLYYKDNQFFLQNNVTADISVRQRSKIIKRFNDFILQQN